MIFRVWTNSQRTSEQGTSSFSDLPHKQHSIDTVPLHAANTASSELDPGDPGPRLRSTLVTPAGAAPVSFAAITSTSVTSGAAPVSFAAITCTSVTSGQPATVSSTIALSPDDRQKQSNESSTDAACETLTATARTPAHPSIVSDGTVGRGDVIHDSSNERQPSGPSPVLASVVTLRPISVLSPIPPSVDRNRQRRTESESAGVAGGVLTETTTHTQTQTSQRLNHGGPAPRAHSVHSVTEAQTASGPGAGSDIVRLAAEYWGTQQRKTPAEKWLK